MFFRNLILLQQQTGSLLFDISFPGTLSPRVSVKHVPFTIEEELVGRGVRNLGVPPTTIADNRKRVRNVSMAPNDTFLRRLLLSASDDPRLGLAP